MLKNGICLYLKIKIFDHFAHAPFWEMVRKRGYSNWESWGIFSRDLYTIGNLWTKFQLYKFFFQKLSNSTGLHVCLTSTLFKTAMFSRFLKVAIPTSNFMNKVYNGGFSPEHSILMLKEILIYFEHIAYWEQSEQSEV